MFNRQSIKQEAKERLRVNHWEAVLVLWIGSLLGGYILSTEGSNLLTNLLTNLFRVWVEFLPQENVSKEMELLFFLATIAMLIVLMLYLLFMLFVGNVVTVGMNGWLMRQWRGQGARVPFSALFDSFRNYKKNVWVMAVQMVVIWLWMLLFLIPGVIKSYAYCMVPFILSENPNVSAKQALKISDKMTYGYKGDLFWMHLSFLGWNWLSALTGGLVGVLYANPYIGMTWAGAYEQLKENAIQSGALTPADFGQEPPQELPE